ncbi:hypothetical protein F8388_000695 [Cannabis sativa]|uniref:Uncharacterized protein n=1 Tax=Cannabis sativa TaxID=3483 RepID=A0A7J6E3E9_CANSA|nr:hypothetical protein F8388_000695 [Cannabis sativa]
MWGLWVWLLSFFFILTLILLVGYQLICLVDLDSDYINLYDSTSRINMVVLPEFITQGLQCLLLVLIGHWVMFVLHIPYFYYNVRQYIEGKHLVDSNEVFKF